MNLGSSDLLDVWLEPPEDVFSTGSFLEPGLHCPPEISVTRQQEHGMQSWTSSGDHGCGLQENEPEDFLKLFINPNEVYCSEASPGSDSSISEDPSHPDSPPAAKAPNSPALFEVVYEAGALENMQGEPVPAIGLISIQLDQWSPPFMMPDTCMVSELPLDAHAHIRPGAGTVAPVPPATLIFVVQDLKTREDMGSFRSRKRTRETEALGVMVMMNSVKLPCQTLFLTDEEKRLLGQEGVSLPSHLPLTKAEERVLKKVRRKIRNKQSAQDSRRRKKEYIDGLESRVATCSAQNLELQTKVQELERHNISLVAQLRQLQSLIAQTSNKAAQTSTCVLILLFSLVLIILPSLSPFQGLPEAGPEDYQSHGVVSRNILTHKDMAENLETLLIESRLRRPSANKGANGSTRTWLEKMGGKTGPRRLLRWVLHADEM